MVWRGGAGYVRLLVWVGAIELEGLLQFAFGLVEQIDGRGAVAAVIALIAVEVGDDATQTALDERDIPFAAAFAAELLRHRTVLAGLIDVLCGGLRRKGGTRTESEDREGERCDSTTEKHKILLDRRACAGG